MIEYFALLLIAFMIGIPVAVSLGGTATFFLVTEKGLSAFTPAIIAQKSAYGLNNFLLLSVPLFLYAGKVMNTGKITNRIFDFCKSLVGWLHGGLGHVNVLASVVFAGMTGTATSDASGLGAIEIQAMREAGYDDDFVLGVTGGSSLIGPIIPPSVPLVIYGMMSGVSIGKLLISGFVPGILLALAVSVRVEWLAKKRRYPADTRFDPADIWLKFKKAFLSLLTPVILIGGMVSGMFTATEAAAMAALYATILSTIIYRDIDLKGLYQIFYETVIDTGSIMMVCYCASIYGYVITKSQVAVKIANSLLLLTTNKYAICLLLVAFLLVLGCFMENIAIITIMTPIFIPVLTAVEYDTLAFGVIMILTLMIGLLTPPFGMVLFVLAKVAEVPLETVIKACIPYIVPVAFVIILLVFFPQIITFLPNMVS
ncbi:MAG: TRAP transporter large permease [Clostridiales bacterium]|nr:TRAP transporter large permease [Clostridiales bacterium]